MSVAFGNRVLTTTQDWMMPALVDTVLNSNVLATRILSSAKKWRGERIKVPIKYAKNNTGTSFSGFDTFSIVGQNTRINMEYFPAFYRIGVTLPLDELSVNASSEEKVLDLIDTELKSTAQDMADDIGTLFYGNGTGNGGKDFLGLGALVDDGTNVASIGGLSRSTYTGLASTVTASGGTLTLAKMSTLYNAISSGSVTPTLGLTTEAIFALYESLLNPQERIVKEVSKMSKKGNSMGKAGSPGLVGGTGFTGLYFKGVPILADEKCTSGALIMINEDFLDFYAVPVATAQAIKYGSVDIQGNDYEGAMGLGFSWSGWKKSLNQATVVGDIYLGGQFITTNPKRHGKLTGITGV